MISNSMKPFSHKGKHTASLANAEGHDPTPTPLIVGVVVNAGRFTVFITQAHINDETVEPMAGSAYEEALQKARAVPEGELVRVDAVPLTIGETRTAMRRGWVLLNSNKQPKEAHTHEHTPSTSARNDRATRKG